MIKSLMEKDSHRLEVDMGSLNDGKFSVMTGYFPSFRLPTLR